MASSGRDSTVSWRGGLSVLVALVCFAAMTQPAAATPLPFTSQPLPGSTFQGGDGDQSDGGGFVDWQSLDGVRHRSDANALDTAFTGGSIGNNPGGWGLTAITNGVGPPADNVRDMWTALQQAGLDTFLYLAFSREGAGGTTYLAFELNRDGRLWDNDDRDATPPVPCRRTDDLDIVYETQGNVPDVEVRRWVTDDADERTSCARRGHFEAAVGVAANVTAQGQLNANAITSHLGGAFDLLLTQRFGEASLNLTAIAEDVFGDRCLAYSSVWMYSRGRQAPLHARGEQPRRRADPRRDRRRHRSRVRRGPGAGREAGRLRGRRHAGDAGSEGGRVGVRLLPPDGAAGAGLRGAHGEQHRHGDGNGPGPGRVGVRLDLHDPGLPGRPGASAAASPGSTRPEAPSPA